MATRRDGQGAEAVQGEGRQRWSQFGNAETVSCEFRPDCGSSGGGVYAGVWSECQLGGDSEGALRDAGGGSVGNRVFYLRECVSVNNNLTTVLVNLLALSAISVSIANGQDAGKDEKRRLYDETKRFSIIPPPGWEDEPKTKGRNAILAKQSGAADSFSNFNVREVKGDGKLPVLKEIADMILQQNQQKTAGFVLDEKAELTINGHPAYFMFFAHESGPGNLKLKAASYMIGSPSNSIYFVTFTMTPTAYERLKPVVKASALTIKLAK